MFDAAYFGARFRHSAHLGARYRISPMSLSHRDRGQFWRYFLMNTEQIEALWLARTALSPKQKEVLAKRYDRAGRSLFVLGRPEYFEALAAHQQLGLNLPLRHRIAAPLARLIGLRSAQIMYLIIRSIKSFVRLFAK